MRPLFLVLLLAACAEPLDSAGSSSLDDLDSGGGDTGGGGDTSADDSGAGGTDTGTDTGSDTGRDTSIVHGDRSADITGHYNGTAFAITWDTSPTQEFYCQDSGDYLLRLQDSGATMQIAISVGDPVEGETTMWPNLGTSLISLGPPASWALDTTFHGTVQSASITVDEFQPLAHIKGSFSVAWSADGNGNPSADAQGSFDLDCG